jgi:cell wall-associated NlpC family hydrolase
MSSDMGIEARYSHALLKIIPSSLVNPKPGDVVRGGQVLSFTPSLASPTEVKFAIFNHPGINIPRLYQKFIPFLPEGFLVAGEPNGQNCYMYCLDIASGAAAQFERGQFNQELENRGYQYQRYSSEVVQVGDVIVYSVSGSFDSYRSHAGVYVGSGRVRSRWGYNSPVIEHPLKEVLPTYWDGDESHLTIERKGM